MLCQLDIFQGHQFNAPNINATFFGPLLDISIYPTKYVYINIFIYIEWYT